MSQVKDREREKNVYIQCEIKRLLKLSVPLLDGKGINKDEISSFEIASA